MHKSIIIIAWSALSSILPFSAAFGSPAKAVIVQATSFHTSYAGYAEVMPVSPLIIRADQTGDLQGFHLMPGSHLKAGEAFARMGGPRVAAELKKEAAKVKEAQQKEALATDALHSARRTYPSFTSRRELDLARENLASAQAQLIRARAEQASLSQRIVLRSPVKGRVMRILAANDQRVASGTAIIKMLPSNGLWLVASYYGREAREIHEGLNGQFVPADGSPPIPVHLVREIPGLRPDGSQRFGLLSTNPADWETGERGRILLNGPARTAVSVPTSALIFNQGQWWVMTLQQGQPHRTPVILGPAHGEDTLVLSGLPAGSQVVVRNAYLLFHHDFAAHYTPPD